MFNPTKYQLFISNKCCSCDEILNLLKKEKIKVPSTNVDKENHHLPFSLVILPALVKEEKLVAYGCKDILSRLVKNQLYAGQT